MILISHRGNISGAIPERENNPNYINEALNAGYECEIDVWYDKQWWSGHDIPKYKINIELMKKCICHAKNTEALYKMIKIKDLHFFWHEDDDHSLTSKQFIWQAHYNNITPKTIVVDCSPTPKINTKCYAICVDYFQ